MKKVNLLRVLVMVLLLFGCDKTGKLYKNKISGNVVKIIEVEVLSEIVNQIEFENKFYQSNADKARLELDSLETMIDGYMNDFKHSETIRLRNGLLRDIESYKKMSAMRSLIKQASKKVDEYNLKLQKHNEASKVLDSLNVIYTKRHQKPLVNYIDDLKSYINYTENQIQFPPTYLENGKYVVYGEVNSNGITSKNKQYKLYEDFMELHEPL